MRNSIKTRLLKAFFLVITSVVVILELVLVYGMSKLAYDNMERMMRDKLDYAINSIIYKDTLDLFEVLDPSFRQYFENEKSQVQLINLDGVVEFDSLGVLYTEPINYPDINMALKGVTGTWRGQVDYSDDNVMAMSRPIVNSSNQTIGVIRNIISLKNIQETIVKLASIFLVAGMITIAFALFMARYISRSIIKPLEELNEVAMEIADGQYDVRSVVDTGDEIEQVSKSINYMAEELVKREQLKNDFISSISHELRTPLTSIKGWAITLISAGSENQELTKEGLKIIVTESERLSSMVEDLLDFSRFVSGRISLKKTRIHTEEFIEQIVSQMKPMVLRAGHIFSIDIADGLADIIADESRLKQVFINIFDNAIKFTEEPGVISLYVKKNNNQIEFTVKDTGIGITQEDIKRVKDKFFKGSLGKAHAGIGLSISDEILELHGGKLILESVVGEGTKATIIVPAISEEVGE